ncbi:MAG: hypothetical protein N3A61_10140, partial [Ignavibacteria bacterium]|nr:hypothetical protein [Ignavibacteria bacterium]
MKTYLIILICLLYQFGFTTSKITIDKHTSNKMILTINFDSEPLALVNERYRFVNSRNFIDETKPGYPILPSKTLFLA